MSVLKIVASSVAVLFLAGCAQSNASLSMAKLQEDSEPKWTNYLENDESMQKIAFYSENLTSTKELKDGSKIGFALTKKQYEGKLQNVKIGDMYASGGKSFSIVDLDRGAYYINMHDKNEVLSLKNSKNIKFYEFGGGILETVVYSANGNLVCEAFISGKSVNAKSVTNYYNANTPDNSNFFVTVMNSKILKNKTPISNSLSFKYFVPETDLAQFKKSVESEEFKLKVIDKDLMKQERILRNIICAEFAK